jgi:hypothetical protein
VSGSSAAEGLICGERRLIMDYVVVLFTMLMIAGFAGVIERVMRAAK